MKWSYYTCTYGSENNQKTEPIKLNLYAMSIRSISLIETIHITRNVIVRSDKHTHTHVSYEFGFCYIISRREFAHEHIYSNINCLVETI